MKRFSTCGCPSLFENTFLGTIFSPRPNQEVLKRLNVHSGTLLQLIVTVCITHLDKLNLIWRFDFRVEPAVPDTHCTTSFENDKDCCSFSPNFFGVHGGYLKNWFHHAKRFFLQFYRQLGPFACIFYFPQKTISRCLLLELLSWKNFQIFTNNF